MAQLVQSPSGGAINTRITTDLQEYEVDYWPPRQALTGSSWHVPVVSALPVSANPRVIEAQIARAFSDDWYHRVHIRPRVLALGNMISTQVEEVEVWNAWLVPVTLAAINGLEEGIALGGVGAPPFPFGALELITWDVTVTPEGPTLVDATLTWDFTGVPDAELAITGTRIVAWALVPNWTHGIKERLVWSTEILSSDRRDEQRRARRLSPRRAFDVELLAEGRERMFFDLMMHGWGARIWAIPIWPDIQRLLAPVALGAVSIACTTTGRDFRAGGLAMLRGASAFLSEVVEIQTVAAGSLTLERPTQTAWPAGTRLYPVRTAWLADQPRNRRLTDQAIGIDALFLLVEPSDWPAAAGLTMYRGFPVFDARPDETEDLTCTFERALHELDNVSGIPVVLDTAEEAFAMQAHRWVLNGVAERSAFRSLLYTLRGRQVAVWIPTHSDDIRLAATIASASLQVTIENVGYERFGLGRLGRQDIRIELRSGSVFYRRITNASVIDDETEELTIDTALGVSVAPIDVRRISFMMLARSDSDTTEIQHVTDVEGVATSRQIFVGVPDE